MRKHGVVGMVSWTYSLKEVSFYRSTVTVTVSGVSTLIRASRISRVRVTIRV